MEKMKKMMKATMIDHREMIEAIKMINIDQDLTEREVGKKIQDIAEIAEKEINKGEITEINMKIESER